MPSLPKSETPSLLVSSAFSPGLWLPFQQPLPSPLGAWAQVVGQLTAHLLHGTQSISLLTRQRERDHINQAVTHSRLKGTGRRSGYLSPQGKILTSLTFIMTEEQSYMDWLTCHKHSLALSLGHLRLVSAYACDLVKCISM